MKFDFRCPNMDGMPSTDMNMMEGATMPVAMGGCQAMPIYECPEERVCHRYICYDVPHIKPCNTRIINHHVYRHTFTPCYTSCEENVVENIYDQRCC